MGTLDLGTLVIMNKKGAYVIGRGILVGNYLAKYRNSLNSQSLM